MLMKLQTVMLSISDFVDIAVRWLTALLTASFTLMIFISVLSRYVFRFSILFTEEISKLLFVWACFFAATIAYRSQIHIRFEFADTLLGKKGIKITNVCINALTLILFIVILLESISFFRQIWETYFPMMGISQGWLYVSVSVSFVVFIVHNVALLVKSVNDLSS